MKTVLAALVPSVLLLGLAAAEEEFTIKLERAGEIGEKRHISARVTSKTLMEMQLNGEPAPVPPDAAENSHYKLEGDFELVAKNAAGHISEVKGMVAKLISVGPDGKATPLLDEGARVGVKLSEDGEVTVTADGEPAGEELSDVLGEFFDLGDEDEFDTDSVFGTDEKQKVGDSWMIDPKVAAKSLAESANGMEIDPEDLTGKLTLHGVVVREGIRCLDIRGELTMKNFSGPLPPGIEVKESLGKATFSGLFPIDEKLSAIEENMSMDFSMKAAGTANGADLAIAVKAAMSKEGTSIPYK